MSLIGRRFIRISMMLALVAGMLGSAGKVGAQGQPGTSIPGQWQSSINLQNPGTTASTVSIQFFDANGGLITTYDVQGGLAANAAVSIFVPAQVAGLAAGQYSAVVVSDQPVLASVNTASTNANTGPWTAFGYEGMDGAGAAATLYFPGLYKGYYNFDSEIVIQNADATAATLTARFYNRQGQEIANIAMGTLAPNASRTFPTTSLTQLPSGNDAGVFGAVVTSTEGRNLVGIANINRTAPTAATASYNAFTNGSSTLFAPALYKGYYGFSSALSLQAVGGPASGTITYSNGATQSFNLAANAAEEFYQPNNASLPSGDTAGVFSAKVTATSGNVVGLVSLDVPGGRRGATLVGSFASYNVPTAASSSVNIPNVLSDYYGYFSAVTVQNTSSSATNITITYAGGQTRTFSNVPANGTINIIHLNNTGDVLPDATSTSAVVSSSNGAPLVAVIQHNTDANVIGYNAAKDSGDFLIAISGTAK